MKISTILQFLKSRGIPFTFAGDETAEVEHFSSLAHYKTGTLVWVKKQESIPADFDCVAVALAIASENVTGDFHNIIRTPVSKYAFFSTLEHFYGENELKPAVGQFTYISPRVKLGRNVRIGYNCTLDGDITVGDDTVIWNGVTIINRVVIGQRCEIQSGCVIGHDGFGYTEDDAHKKTMVKHFGGVTVGDDVLIRSNVCIDRGTIDDTIIEDGVKIDDLSHIAHNVWIRKNAALAAPCRLNGSVHVGENAYLAGVVVRNQCSIGENAFAGLGAVIVCDIPANTVVVGNPAKPFKKKEV